jgi:hypothetical protein
MKGQRDLIAEITEKRGRFIRRVDRYEQFSRRHDEIIESVDFLARYATHTPMVRIELLKYIPIGIVACWEGYLRMLLADLIDSGSPFRENATKLDVGKFDVSAVLATGAKRVSAGELVAHQLRLNNLDDVNKTMSTVLGIDFLSELRATRHPDDETPIYEIGDDIPGMLKDIFQYRHIWCHELAVRTQPTIKGARDATTVSMVFIYHTEILAQGMLGKEQPPIL